MRRRQAACCGEPLGEGRDSGGRGIELGVEAAQGEVDLSGGAVVPAVELAPQDDPRPHTRPDGQEREVVDSAGNAAPALPERGEVDVVLERDGQAQPLLELGVEWPILEPRHVLGEVDPPGVGLDDTGDPDHDAVDQLLRELRGLHERGAERGDRLDRRLGVGRGQLDVLACANLAGEIAGGPAQEVRAEVEAEHERRVGGGLEVDGAVGGAAGIGRRAGHPAGSSIC